MVWLEPVLEVFINCILKSCIDVRLIAYFHLVVAEEVDVFIQGSSDHFSHVWVGAELKALHQDVVHHQIYFSD